MRVRGSIASCTSLSGVERQAALLQGGQSGEKTPDGRGDPQVEGLFRRDPEDIRICRQHGRGHHLEPPWTQGQAEVREGVIEWRHRVDRLGLDTEALLRRRARILFTIDLRQAPESSPDA